MMKDFFHGWRRKVGCVTLAMALALAAIWVRSTRIDDAIRFTIAGRTNLLRSSERGLHWYAWDKKWTVATPTWTSQVFLEKSSEWDVVQWRKDFALDGCHPDLTTIFFVEAPHGDWFVPHIGLVLPFTILSACLILFRPRKWA